jgi:AcrR family transcriptional regulator
MDAAERLFAERGIDAVSLRTINSAAGYSAAALHYHFATRDGLIQALLERAQPRMLAERARLLAALRPLPHPPLEAIVEALILPLTIGMAEDFPAALAKLRFLVRLSFDRSPYLVRTIEDSVALFLPLLQRALPHLDERALKRRWRFAADLTQHALATALGAGTRAAHSPRRELFEDTLRELSAFICGGLRA